MSRQGFEHNVKKLCRDIKTGSRQNELAEHRRVLSRHENWVTTANIDNTKKSCCNIRTKLQQEVKLSGNRPLSRQTLWAVIEIQIIQDNVAT